MSDETPMDDSPRMTWRAIVTLPPMAAMLLLILLGEAADVAWWRMYDWMMETQP